MPKTFRLFQGRTYKLIRLSCSPTAKADLKWEAKNLLRPKENAQYSGYRIIQYATGCAALYARIRQPYD